MPKEMSRKEFYQKYGDVLVRFSSYYKYVFTYMADLEDGSVLTCDYGGNHHDIYCFIVDRTSITNIANLMPFAGRVRKNGKEIERFHDY